MSVSLASYSCPNILLCICQLQPYHAVQQHSFSELHNILLHTQLKMCPKKWWTIKKQPLHQRVWHFSLHKSTVAKKKTAEKQQKNSRHWGDRAWKQLWLYIYKGQCKQNPYNITFHKQSQFWMGRRGKCPLIRMFLFHTSTSSSNMNHYSWVPILLHTVCNIKPLNLNFCKL